MVFWRRSAKPQQAAEAQPTGGEEAEAEAEAEAAVPVEAEAPAGEVDDPAAAAADSLQDDGGHGEIPEEELGVVTDEEDRGGHRNKPDDVVEEASRAHGVAIEEEVEEEEESDPAADWEALEARLREVHPKLKDTNQLVADEELQIAIRARRHASISFNSKFVMGTRPGQPLGAMKAPAVVGVTGHRGQGGNIGINGIYELYPEFYQDRPVYQKMLEKRVVADLEAAPPGGLRVDRPRPMSPRSRVEANRAQRKLIVKAPLQRGLGQRTMWPVPNAWFLFFDPGTGCWVIGPKVGHLEHYARCPGTEEPIPDALDRWQVWDVGHKIWYEHDTLRTFKGGKGVR